MLSAMRCDWLRTSTGVNVVAIGLATIAFSIIVFTLQDFAILFSGKPYTLHGVDDMWCLSLGAIAVVFSAMTVFIRRPGWPRIVIALFGISMASHILMQFLSLSAQGLRLVALCRVFVAAAMVLLVLRYRSTATSEDP